MSIGANVSVIAIGTILAVAMHAHTPGLNVAAVGAVLIVVGVAGLAMQLASLVRQRRLTAVSAARSRSVIVRPREAVLGVPPYRDPAERDGWN